MFEITYTDEARADLRAIGLYILRRSGSRNIAANFVRKIRGVVEAIRPSPYMWPQTASNDSHELNYRKRPLGNYVIIYSVDDELHLITIARIFHAARDYGKLLEEDEDHEDKE